MTDAPPNLVVCPVCTAPMTREDEFDPPICEECADEFDAVLLDPEGKRS